VSNASPPRWKSSVLVWLGIYPALTLVLWLVGPMIKTWPLPVRTFVLTAVLVPLMVYVLLPGLNRLLAPWIRPRVGSDSGPTEGS
jgi:antibiotic biosynthesis monooxygenase (ABM) superfamily enzyme